MSPAAKPAALPPHRLHPHLLELNAWAWLERLSRRARRKMTLAEIPDAEWDAIAGLGFDFVWLMGVWERSPASRLYFQADTSLYPAYERALPGWKTQDIAGSPYAVRNYVPDARMGGWAGVDRAREKLHGRGMRLVLDFVVNHTALDHPWTKSHPEYYVRGTLADFERDPSAFFAGKGEGSATTYIAYGRDPYFPPWRDVAQLNHTSTELRRALVAELCTIASHCDGMRCDMAMLALNDIFQRTWGGLLRGAPSPATEFWNDVLAQLPERTWIAEVYWDLEWRLQQLGFQFTYDKRLYDRLRASPARDVRGHLSADLAYQSRMARFLENHDEERAAVAFASRTPAAAALVATLPGMRFYHEGQFDGCRIHLPIALAVAAPEKPDSAAQALYRTLLRESNHPVFHTGEWKLLEAKTAGEASFDDLVVHRWRLDHELKVIAANLGAGTAQGLVPLGDEVSPAMNYIFRDEMTGTEYRWKGSDLAAGGLYVKLPAGAAHLFTVLRAG